MPKYPKYLKNFATACGITAHLAQMSSKCNAWKWEQIGPHLSINLPLSNSDDDSGTTLSNSVPSSPTQDLQAYNDISNASPNHVPAEDLSDSGENFSFNEGGYADEDPMIMLSVANHTFLAQLGQGCMIKYFLGTSSIYLGGKSFLNCFKMDPYSMQRQENL